MSTKLQGDQTNTSTYKPRCQCTYRCTYELLNLWECITTVDLTLHLLVGLTLARIHTSDNNPNGIDCPSSPGFSFGSCQQRPDDTSFRAPGAIYTLPDPRTSVGASFAVHGSVPDMLHLGGSGPVGGSKCTLIGRPQPPMDITPGDFQDALSCFHVCVFTFTGDMVLKLSLKVSAP